MTRLLVIVAAALITAAFCACSDGRPSTENGTGSNETDEVTGIVFKDENGDGLYDVTVDSPLSGVTVSMWLGDHLTARTQTGSDGYYELSAPVGSGYSIALAMRASVECYDPRVREWSLCNSISGTVGDVACPTSGLNVAARYRNLDYGPKGFEWELWHAGPILDRPNVVLVHGYRFITLGSDGRCDEQFVRLDDLLQTKDDWYNVWQFEYGHGYWGTLERISVYSEQLNQALEVIEGLTNGTSTVITHSIGGFIARKCVDEYDSGRMEKLMTLGTPHFGIRQLGPVDLRWLLNWADRFGPKARPDVIPGSRFLWDLNSRVEDTIPDEFASIAGYSTGHSDGLVEISSASLVQSASDGTVEQRFYFVGVDRHHPDLNAIESKEDEVFQLISPFVEGGVEALGEYRPGEYPSIYSGHPYVTFSLGEEPPEGYPRLLVARTGREYGPADIFSQGEHTADGGLIYAVQLQYEDAGKARLYYAPDSFADIVVPAGQSTLVTGLIGG